MSDKWFNGSRYSIAVTFGVLFFRVVSAFPVLLAPRFVNILAMVLFGIAIGGPLICFVGGLMAVDLVPRRASGAALGIIGIASYVGAGIQDIIAAPCSTSTKPSSMASRHTITASHRYSGSPHRFCHSCW